jgi:hypothetical protein
MPESPAFTQRFRISAKDQRQRSPFNARLCASIADTPDIAAFLSSAEPEQQLPVLLLASVHSIVLAEPGLELAAWYPTVAAAPRDDDAFPAFARLCRERETEIRALIATHATQTNEVGRCSLFVPALDLVAEEVGTLGLADIGTSAGLNLQLDRYHYVYEPGGPVGAPSPVTLHCGVHDGVPIPLAIPPIGARVGVDRAPIDLTDPDSVRWLQACVWPDQHDRFERLAAAIAVAADHPADVIQGDAIAALDGAIARVGADAHPTVINSWVLNYLTPAERAAYVAELDRIGAERDLSWLFLESPGLAPGLPFPAQLDRSFLTHLVLARWRGGHRSVIHLAECHPHGYWLHWSA